jgi:hypothetical protein
MVYDVSFRATNGFTPGIRPYIYPTGNAGIRATIANASLAVLRGDGIVSAPLHSREVYSSQFNYSISEDTYIRLKDSSKYCLQCEWRDVLMEMALLVYSSIVLYLPAAVQ